MSTKRSIFQNTTFRKLFSAQLIALAGTGLTTIALALLAYQIAGDRAGLVLGTALAIKMIAFIFVAPVVGGLIRPDGRKQLLVALDIARAACVLLLPFVTSEWQIYTLIFVLNACSAGFTPTFQSIIPQIFSDEENYTKALSMARLAYDLENLLSPTIAAGLLLVVSFDVFFVANSAAFIISAGLVLSTNLPIVVDMQDRALSAKDKIAQGFQIYRKTPRLMGMLAMFLVVSAAGAMVIVNTVVLVRGQFGGGESMVAFAMSAFGLGSLVAALMVPRLVRRLGDQAVMRRGGWLLGIVMLLAGYVGRFDLLLVVWFLLGIGYSLVQTPAGRVLRRSASDDDLPKLFAAQFTLSHACWLLSYPAAGWMASALGFQTAFLVFALISLVAMFVSQQLWQNDDPAEIEHQHDELYHDHLHYHGPHHQHAHEGWEGPEPHRHPHKHDAVRHSHKYVIDGHHTEWPAKTN